MSLKNILGPALIFALVSACGGGSQVGDTTTDTDSSQISTNVENTETPEVTGGN